MTRQSHGGPTHGFTLIELSIVLVIIGLIVGGVLAGQDLIRAAQVRAQVSQIERLHTAVNTFRVKFAAMPGDLNAAVATQFGFSPRGQYAGEGDGNEVIEGISADGPGNNSGTILIAGETAMFWVDLTSANGQNLNLIQGSFTAANPTVPAMPPPAGTVVGRYLPEASIGGSNYIYVYSSNMVNYYGLSAVASLIGSGSTPHSNTTIAAAQAYELDKKIDDGLPLTGRVTAYYITDLVGGCWGAGCGAGSPSTCYDNDGIGGTAYHYSLEVNGGAGTNCGLSFQFQ